MTGGETTMGGIRGCPELFHGFWGRALVLLVACVTQVLSQTVANTSTLTSLQAGDALPSLTLNEGQYQRYITSLKMLSTPTVVTIIVSPTDGDVDVFISDKTSSPSRSYGEFDWRSNRQGARKQETVVIYLHPGSVDLYTGVECYNGKMRYFNGQYIQQCDFTIQVFVERFSLIPLIDRASPPIVNVLRVGKYLFYEFEVFHGGLQEVMLNFATDYNDRLSADLTVKLIVSMNPQWLFLQQAWGAIIPEGRDGRLQFVTTSRGENIDMKLYVEGPTTLYISINNGLETPTPSMDLDMVVTAAGHTGVVQMHCLYSNRLDTPHMAIGYEEVHFWVLPMLESQQILRMEVDTPNGQVDFLADSGEWPLPMDAFKFFQRAACGPCAQTLRPDAARVPVPAVQQEAEYVCRKAIQTVYNKTSIRYLLFSIKGNIPSFDSNYVLRAMEMNAQCGWRPNCQSCSDGGKSCTWCNGHNGYCDDVDAAVREYSSCQQTAWCADISPCTQAATCDECHLIANCGWCGNSQTKGVCTQGDPQGPSNGICDTWLYGEDADCNQQCTIHNDVGTRTEVCSLCAAESACGYCVSPVKGTCAVGSAAGSALGTCPSASTLWVHDGDDCFKVTGQLPTDVEPAYIGQEANMTLSLSESGDCFLSACSFRVLAVPLSAGQVVNMYASVAVSPPNADVQLFMAHGDSATSEAHEARSVPVHTVGMLHQTLTEQERGYALAAGVCQENQEQSVYFTIQVAAESPAREASVRFRADAQPSELVIVAGETTGESELLNQYLCCGGMRHHAVTVDGGDSGWLEVRLDYHQGSLVSAYLQGSEYQYLKAYARAGACASAAIYDHKLEDASSGNLRLPLLKDGVTWHIGVVGSADAMTSYNMYFKVEIGDSFLGSVLGVASDENNLLYGVVGAASASLAICVLLGMWYVRKRRKIAHYKCLPTKNQLLANSDALALGLEDGADHKLLSWENPLRSVELNPLQSSGALSLIKNGTSSEEMELLGMIEGMAEKIKALEQQNDQLRSGRSNLLMPPPSHAPSGPSWDPGATPQAPTLHPPHPPPGPYPVAHPQHQSAASREERASPPSHTTSSAAPSGADLPKKQPAAAPKAQAEAKSGWQVPSTQATRVKAARARSLIDPFGKGPSAAAIQHSEERDQASTLPVGESSANAGKVLERLETPDILLAATPIDTDHIKFWEMGEEMDPAYQPHLTTHAGLDLNLAMLKSAFPPPANAAKSPLLATLANQAPPAPATYPLSSAFHFHSTALTVERAHSETMATVPNISVYGGYADSMSRNNSANNSLLSVSHHSPTASSHRRGWLDIGSGANAHLAATATAHGLNKIDEQDPESSMNGINQTSLRDMGHHEGCALQDVLLRSPGAEDSTANPEPVPESLLPTVTIQEATSEPVVVPASAALLHNESSVPADQFLGSVTSPEVCAERQSSPPAHPAMEDEELAHPAVQEGMISESSAASGSNVASNLRRPSRADSSVASEFPPLPTREAREVKPVHWRVELLCPDGSSLLCSTGVQILGRGMGGVTSKKVSREQAALIVDTHTGAVTLSVRGKNGMLWRGADHEPWVHLTKNESKPLDSENEFSLFGRDDGAGGDLENVTFTVLIRNLHLSE